MRERREKNEESDGEKPAFFTTFGGLYGGLRCGCRYSLRGRGPMRARESLRDKFCLTPLSALTEQYWAQAFLTLFPGWVELACLRGVLALSVGARLAGLAKVLWAPSARRLLVLLLLSILLSMCKRLCDGVNAFCFIVLFAFVRLLGA